MVEHRLIERWIAIFRREQQVIEKQARVSTECLRAGVDFMRFYADRTHHGKEEDILFTELAERNLSPELVEIMGELVADHERARQLVGRLESLTCDYEHGDAGAAGDIAQVLAEIVALYPEHIRKEDKEFFGPSMKYFTEEELGTMLGEFEDFDGSMIHERYEKIVVEHEGS
jgi:hemerythrin-like domain-containing protein